MEKTVIIKGNGQNKEEIMKDISNTLDEIFAEREKEHKPKHAKKENYPFIHIKVDGDASGYNSEVEFDGDPGEVLEMLSASIVQTIANLDGEPLQNLLILNKFTTDRICEGDFEEDEEEEKDGKSK